LHVVILYQQGMSNLHTIGFHLKKVSLVQKMKRKHGTRFSYVVCLDFPQRSDRTLRNCNGGTIAMVSKEFWNSLHMECSGRLRTGECVSSFRVKQKEFFSPK